jgi:prepilin-type N-terminal cleavage/methylation domain-containing protein
MKLNLQDQRGVTLIELLITMTVVSVLAIVAMNFMVNWFRQNAITQTRAVLLAESQDALDFIADSIRLSSAADETNRYQDPNSLGAPSDLFSWKSNQSTLVLASAAEDTSGNILFSDPANYTSYKNNQIYFVNNEALYRRTLAASVAGNKAKTSCPTAKATASCPVDRRIASNVSSFSVKYLDAQNQQVTPPNARSIELSITLRKKIQNQWIESSDKTRMVFRNY